MNKFEEIRMRRLRVKELAEQRGMTQSKLMRMADLNMKTVQGLFREPFRINVAYLTLEKVAHALDVEIADLFEEVEAQDPADSASK
jgi:transcriptional regulator with XRE-family HTH domain